MGRVFGVSAYVRTYKPLPPSVGGLRERKVTRSTSKTFVPPFVPMVLVVACSGRKNHVKNGSNSALGREKEEHSFVCCATLLRITIRKEFNSVCAGPWQPCSLTAVKRIMPSAVYVREDGTNSWLLTCLVSCLKRCHSKSYCDKSV